MYVKNGQLETIICKTILYWFRFELFLLQILVLLESHIKAHLTRLISSQNKGNSLLENTKNVQSKQLN